MSAASPTPWSNQERCGQSVAVAVTDPNVLVNFPDLLTIKADAVHNCSTVTMSPERILEVGQEFTCHKEGLLPDPTTKECCGRSFTMHDLVKVYSRSSISGCGNVYGLRLI